MQDVDVVLTEPGYVILYQGFQKRLRRARVGRTFNVYVGRDLAGTVSYMLVKHEKDGHKWETPTWFADTIEMPSKQAAVEHLLKST